MKNPQNITQSYHEKSEITNYLVLSNSSEAKVTNHVIVTPAQRSCQFWMKLACIAPFYELESYYWSYRKIRLLRVSLLYKSAHTLYHKIVN